MKKFEQSMMPMLAGLQKKTVSIETVTQSFDIIRIYLPDSINELDEHMDQIEAIRNASENDIIEVYCISNRGGYVDTIVPLCNALATTPAHTVCFVEGHCASAGTFPSMVCAEVCVGAYASFMLHCAQGGSGHGTMVNSAESAKFFEKQYSDLLEDIYYGFITPEEARMLHDGRELYLTAEEIEERLKKRAELMAAETEEEDCCHSMVGCCEMCVEDSGEPMPQLRVEPSTTKKEVLPKRETVFKKGMKVHSPQYGEGVVDSVSDGYDDEVHVIFDSGMKINFTLDGIDYSDFPDGEPTLEVVLEKSPTKKKAPVKKASPKKAKAFNENDDPDFEKPKAPLRAPKVTK